MSSIAALAPSTRTLFPSDIIRCRNETLSTTIGLIWCACISIMQYVLRLSAKTIPSNLLGQVSVSVQLALLVHLEGLVPGLVAVGKLAEPVVAAMTTTMKHRKMPKRSLTSC